MIFEPDGEVLYKPGFVEDAGLMDRLRETLPLKQEALRIFGSSVLTPRLVSWHGDPLASYSYSGSRFAPLPWPEAVSDLRTKLGAFGEFNSMLVNFYRDGKDSVGFHADDEPELGPVIASISLGARRRFVLKRKSDGLTHEFALGEGDLLVMRGALQKHWVHGIPKTAKYVGPRMNLTFRQVRV